MSQRPFDLNDPDDAREYIQTWIDLGSVVLKGRQGPVVFEDGTDEDCLRVARQLFLYADPRPVLGDVQ